MNALQSALTDRLVELDKAVHADKIEDIVDLSAELNQIYKRIEAALKESKEIIRKYGVEEELPEVEGNAFIAKIQPRTETIIDPKKLQIQMTKEGMKERFWDFVAVKVEATQKFLGSASLAKITTKQSGTPSIVFKPL